MSVYGDIAKEVQRQQAEPDDEDTRPWAERVNYDPNNPNSSRHGEALGLTGDTATDKAIINQERNYPKLDPNAYILAPSTSPDNQAATTEFAKQAWIAGAGAPWRGSPYNATEDYNPEADRMNRNLEALYNATQGAYRTGDLANTMANDRGMFLGAAQGTAPSAAAIQQQQGLAQAMRNQLGLGATLGGPAAAYMAQSGAGNLQRQVAADAAMLRAQEQAQGRADLVARDQAEAAVRQAYGNQLLGVGAGQSQAMQDWLALHGQRQNVELASRGLNDQLQLGMYGLTNQFLGTSVDQAKVDLANRVAAQEAAARYQEAQADQFQRWLSQWVANETGARASDANRQGAYAGAGATLLASLLGSGKSGD